MTETRNSVADTSGLAALKPVWEKMCFSRFSSQLTVVCHSENEGEICGKMKNSKRAKSPQWRLFLCIFSSLSLFSLQLFFSYLFHFRCSRWLVLYVLLLLLLLSLLSSSLSPSSSSSSSSLMLYLSICFYHNISL